MTIAVEKVTHSFMAFSETIAQFLPIRTEGDYIEAVNLMEKLMFSLDDSGNDPVNNLLDIIAHSIDEFENQKPEMQLFIEQVEALHSEVAVLRVLMDQYNLSMNDFQNEIGKKSYVSMILKGNRELSRKHIGKLCERFKISPALFYERPFSL